MARLAALVWLHCGVWVGSSISFGLDSPVDFVRFTKWFLFLAHQIALNASLERFGWAAWDWYFDSPSCLKYASFTRFGVVCLAGLVWRIGVVHLLQKLS